MIAGLVLGVAVPVITIALLETRRVLRNRAADQQAHREALVCFGCDVCALAVHGDQLYGDADRAAPGNSGDLSRLQDGAQGA